MSNTTYPFGDAAGEPVRRLSGTLFQDSTTTDFHDSE